MSATASLAYSSGQGLPIHFLVLHGNRPQLCSDHPGGAPPGLGAAFCEAEVKVAAGLGSGLGSPPCSTRLPQADFSPCAAGLVGLILEGQQGSPSFLPPPTFKHPHDHVRILM